MFFPQQFDAAVFAYFICGDKVVQRVIIDDDIFVKRVAANHEKVKAGVVCCKGLCRLHRSITVFRGFRIEHQRRLGPRRGIIRKDQHVDFGHQHRGACLRTFIRLTSVLCGKTVIQNEPIIRYLIP
ncbi:hypothetical protein SDC9_203615 [bioreactor metagenome]|uniref:Uncharacterized protein n=1 Tax=bioreactor metagenome TaxID=1076179 RepID=A0A645IX67_9ZZZZ